MVVFFSLPQQFKPNCSKTIIDMEKNFFVYGSTVTCPCTLIDVFQFRSTGAQKIRFKWQNVDLTP